MKKIIAFLCSILLCFSSFFAAKDYLKKQVSYKYYDKAGDILNDVKFKSLTLKDEAVKIGGNLFMFGSSEFEASASYNTHPSIFFNHRKADFQVNLIGRGGYRCLVHAADFGAIGEKLKGQKVVFVLSPQWFVRTGIDEKTFEANSSELQVYGFFFNPSLSRHLKSAFANRILNISKKNPNKDFQIMRNYCELYVKNDVFHRGIGYLMTPYYWMRYELLSLKDEINSYKLLSKNKGHPKHEHGEKVTFNWEQELANAEKMAQMSSTNPFGMDDKRFEDYQKQGLEHFKGYYKNTSYRVSPEYEDFKLLLDICKAEGISPLILNIPVNGLWYDYTEFSREDRQAYYANVSKIIASYGFKEADFSKYEYEKYFLKDGSHIGWKGWVYVNEAIDKYYHED